MARDNIQIVRIVLMRTQLQIRLLSMLMLRIRPFAGIPPKCVINILEVLERAKHCTHLVKEGGFLEDTETLKKIDKIIVSVFMVDKRSCKICYSTKSSCKIITLSRDPSPYVKKT